MSLARGMLLRASRSKWLAGQMSQRAFARRAVKKFMPGEDVGAALDAAEVLATEQLGTVITQLGENLTTLGEADQVREHYLGVLDTIKARGQATVVSVKPTQLGLDLSAPACLANIDALAARAQSASMFARHAGAERSSPSCVGFTEMTVVSPRALIVSSTPR